MKHYLYPTLFIFLLSGVNKTIAQTAQYTDPEIVSGYFEIHTAEGNGTNNINVNYGISTVPFTNKLNLELSTTNSIFFSADLLDATNRLIVRWVPKACDNYYNHMLDITSLQHGNYHLNIHRDNASAIVYSIPFTK